MAKLNIVKCRYCKREIEKDTAFSPQKGMYYCDEECYEQSQNKKKAQKNFKSDKGSTREFLTDYIQSLYLNAGYNKNNIPWALIGSQISNLLKNNPMWKYSTIQYILWYMVEIKNLNLFDRQEGSILNLVEFYYQESREHYAQCEEIRQSLEDFKFEDKITVIKSSDNKTKTNIKF